MKDTTTLTERLAEERRRIKAQTPMGWMMGGGVDRLFDILEAMAAQHEAGA